VKSSLASGHSGPAGFIARHRHRVALPDAPQSQRWRKHLGLARENGGEADGAEQGVLELREVVLQVGRVRLKDAKRVDEERR
jgi:hypothetical protein